MILIVPTEEGTPWRDLQCRLPLLRTYRPHENLEHKSRVGLYSESWDDYSTVPRGDARLYIYTPYRLQDAEKLAARTQELYKKLYG